MSKVLTWPNNKLTKVAKEVKHGESCRALIEAMFEALEYPTGIGLAAPQIGVNKRVIVINVPAMKNGKLLSGSTKHAIINPVIAWKKGAMVLGPEGCLSFPGEQVIVPRWPRVKVQGFDVRWNPITIGGKGLVARVLQHEIDHLDGRTLDHYAQIAKEVFDDADVS